jgi:WD40 repeat protein
MKLDRPTELTKVKVPHGPNSLTWSVDDTYLAAGAWGWQPVGKKAETSEILVIDVARGSVKATLEASAEVSCLAFSPDGKWLVVGTSVSPYTGDARAEVVVFDVPAFSRKFTGKPGGAKAGFIDVGWSADGKTLCAIEGSGADNEKNQVRRWAVPAFTEGAAIRTPQAGKFQSLAVSADGRTLVVADQPGLLQLFDLTSGKGRPAIKSSGRFDRVGFTADGKAVAAFDADGLSWYDAETGKPAKPNPARVATRSAGLSDRSHYAVLPDGSKRVRASERHPTAVFQKESETEHGAFIQITDGASGKKWNWRAGETSGTTDTPVLAISADGSKLAGTVRLADGKAVVIWSMPK